MFQRSNGKEVLDQRRVRCLVMFVGKERRERGGGCELVFEGSDREEVLD